MAKRQWVVRVVLQRGKDSFPMDVDARGLPAFLECLRHAGLVQIHRDDDDGMCLDLLPSGGSVDSKVWSEQTAARMESFGYNAVSAPRMP